MPTSFWRTVLHIGVLGYGLLYAMLCIASLLDDISNRTSASWILFNAVMDALACTGIFALGVQSLRRPWMTPIWSVFPFILPVALAITCTWEIVNFAPPLSSVEVVVSLVAVTAFVSPAIWLNFRLRSALSKRV